MLQKSNFIMVAEALEMGIPIEFQGYLCKLIEGEIKFAAVCSKRGDIYMGNMGWDFVYHNSKNLDDGDRVNLVFMMSNIKERLEKGISKDDLTFQHEDEFFKKLKGILPNASRVQDREA